MRSLNIEEPDDTAAVDFLDNRAGCSVRLTLDRKAKELRVQVFGADDRVTILCDEVYKIPKPDNRR